MSYVIGGLVYTLNDIENGVLRANRKPLAALRRPFSRSDMRLQIALKECDARVHFALVCGARSCPPVKTYTAEVGICNIIKCKRAQVPSYECLF